MTPFASTQPGSLADLAARMPLLLQAEHPLGMKKSRAEAFVRAVGANGDVPKALEQAGGFSQLAEILSKARPSDPTLALLRLLPILSEVAILRRSFKTAASYPLALLFSFGIAAWAVFSLSLPALKLLAQFNSGEPAPALTLEIAICAASAVAILLLAALTSKGARIPGLTRGIALLDRALVLETAATLVEGQVLLPIAISSACLWADPAMRAAGDAVARAFDSGTAPTGVEPLLDPEAAAILCASAQRGVAGPVLRALAQQALIEARCQVPRELRRVQSAALFLAGLALGTLAIGWYHAYLNSTIG